MRGETGGQRLPFVAPSSTSPIVHPASVVPKLPIVPTGSSVVTVGERVEANTVPQKLYGVPNDCSSQ